MKRVLYPGSFDPITKGHMNIIDQADELFDEVVIAVFCNPLKKNGYFTIDEREEMIRELYKNREKIKVVSGIGAAVDVAQKYDCKAIIRGLRSISDFDYEIQLQQINREISNNKINTICLFADKEYQYISSSMVRELVNLDKDIGRYVEPFIQNKMLTKRKK